MRELFIQMDCWRTIRHFLWGSFLAKWDPGRGTVSIQSIHHPLWRVTKNSRFVFCLLTLILLFMVLITPKCNPRGARHPPNRLCDAWQGQNFRFARAIVTRDERIDQISTVYCLWNTVELQLNSIHVSLGHWKQTGRKQSTNTHTLKMYCRKIGGFLGWVWCSK